MLHSSCCFEMVLPYQVAALEVRDTWEGQTSQTVLQTSSTPILHEGFKPVTATDLQPVEPVPLAVSPTRSTSPSAAPVAPTVGRALPVTNGLQGPCSPQAATGAGRGADIGAPAGTPPPGVLFAEEGEFGEQLPGKGLNMFLTVTLVLIAEHLRG